MAGNTEYQKYKQPIKIWCLVQVAASIAALIAIICLFFIPNFAIDLSENEEVRTTLPKIENMSEDILNDLDDIEDLEDLEKALENAGKIDFSIFDEVYAVANPVELENEGDNGYASASNMITQVMSIYQWFALAALVAAFGLMVYSVVKSCTGIVSLDMYALKTYDELKRREKKKGAKFTPVRLLVIAVVLEAFCIIYNKMMGGMLNSNVVTSYFALMKGLSGWATVTIIFAIITVGGFIAAKYLKSRIATQILKEDYAQE